MKQSGTLCSFELPAAIAKEFILVSPQLRIEKLKVSDRLAFIKLPTSDWMPFSFKRVQFFHVKKTKISVNINFIIVHILHTLLQQLP